MKSIGEALLKRIMSSHATLLDFLEEAHAPEVEAKHHGDPASSCSYCKAIAEGRRVQS